MLYWLKRTGYSGWLTLDIFPYREDGIQSATESIQWIDSILKRIDEVGMDTIDEVIKANDGVASVRFMRNFFMSS